jgi:hypothetical protein
MWHLERIVVEDREVGLRADLERPIAVLPRCMSSAPRRGIEGKALVDGLVGEQRHPLGVVILGVRGRHVARSG